MNSAGHVKFFFRWRAARWGFARFFVSGDGVAQRFDTAGKIPYSDLG